MAEAPMRRWIGAAVHVSASLGKLVVVCVLLTVLLCCMSGAVVGWFAAGKNSMRLVSVSMYSHSVPRPELHWQPTRPLATLAQCPRKTRHPPHIVISVPSLARLSNQMGRLCSTDIERARV